MSVVVRLRVVVRLMRCDVQILGGCPRERVLLHLGACRRIGVRRLIFGRAFE